MVIRNTKSEFEHSVIYKDLKYNFALGGLHACVEPSIHESSNSLLIKSCDVAGYYPNFAVKNRLHPRHLGEIFVDIYDKNVVEAKKIAKINKDISTEKATKLAGNATYGKSNDDNSFLKDPMYTMKTTVNCQLLLAMLCEELSEHFKILMVNTDGLECLVPPDKVDLYHDICNSWCNHTNLQLEYMDYQKMIIRDINNYIGIYTNGKVKYKGAFKPACEMMKDGEYHKDSSFNIVAVAISEWATKAINPMDVITNVGYQYEVNGKSYTTSIFDYCGRHKTNRDCYSEIRWLDLDSNKIKHEKQQKTTRYYISNKGYPFFRMYHSGDSAGTEEAICKGYKVTIFNNYELKDNYNINYNFYIREVNKILNIVDNKQINLL